MTSRSTSGFRRLRSYSLAFVAIAAGSGCSGGGGSGSSSFSVRTTSQSVAANTHVAISGRHLAYLADEATTGATGTDFNTDGDKIDSIAVVVDMNSNQQTVLNVAADELVWIGDELYLVTSEAEDDFDWNGDTDMTDLVLLHWSALTATVQRVDDLASAGTVHVVARGTNLFYASATAPVGALSTNLEIVSAGAPLVHTALASTDAVGPLSPRFITIDEGLVFLALDETAEARDLNGDADATDTAVLALFDGTVTNPVVRSTRLALPNLTAPLRATSSASHDWRVGFLVSETAQGATNLNLPSLFSGSWQPPQCSGDDDADTLDNVLHTLSFAAWNSDPVAHAPVNTGLVGVRRICFANGFVATISLESDEGTCDLNGDGDTTDFVVRWTQVVDFGSPVLPVNAVADIHAVFDCPGGTRGLAELDDRFVIEVSETDDEFDVDGGGFNHNLLGWLLPTNTAHAWDFTHGSGNTTFVGATWMAEVAGRSRLGVAFPENIAGVNVNAHTPPVTGEDTDTNDSLPTFADFTATNTLSFPGVAVAVDLDNAGITIGKNIAFYRVSEVDDRRDWNNDGDETDIVLFRTSLTQATTNAMGVLNNVVLGGNPTPSVLIDTVGTPQGAAYLFDESIQGLDVNSDGTVHFVVQYFRF